MAAEALSAAHPPYLADLFGADTCDLGSDDGAGLLCRAVSLALSGPAGRAGIGPLTGVSEALRGRVLPEVARAGAWRLARLRDSLAYARDTLLGALDDAKAGGAADDAAAIQRAEAVARDIAATIDGMRATRTIQARSPFRWPHGHSGLSPIAARDLCCPAAAQRRAAAAASRAPETCGDHTIPEWEAAAYARGRLSLCTDGIFRIDAAAERRAAVGLDDRAPTASPPSGPAGGSSKGFPSIASGRPRIGDRGALHMPREAARRAWDASAAQRLLRPQRASRAAGMQRTRGRRRGRRSDAPHSRASSGPSQPLGWRDSPTTDFAGGRTACGAHAARAAF